MQLVAHGKLDVYGPRGSYSLIVDRVEAQGVGALLARLEQLKAELGALGWFERRRPLPSMPRRIGVVTSRDGGGAARLPADAHAALAGVSGPAEPHARPGTGRGARDRRGDRAPGPLRCGCDRALPRRGLARGSLGLQRARGGAGPCGNASVPVVCGVGHETDTTLADFVADHRAHTPTDGRECGHPGSGRAGGGAGAPRELLDRGGRPDRRGARRTPERLRAPPGAPERGLDPRPPREGAGRRTPRSCTRAPASACSGQARARPRCRYALERLSPSARLERQRADLEAKGVRLVSIAARRMEESESRLERAASGLEAISPLRRARPRLLVDVASRGGARRSCARRTSGPATSSRRGWRRDRSCRASRETRLVDRPGDRPDDPDARRERVAVTEGTYAVVVNLDGGRGEPRLPALAARPGAPRGAHRLRGTTRRSRRLARRRPRASCRTCESSATRSTSGTATDRTRALRLALEAGSRARLSS